MIPSRDCDSCPHDFHPGEVCGEPMNEKDSSLCLCIGTVKYFWKMAAAFALAVLAILGFVSAIEWLIAWGSR